MRCDGREEEEEEEHTEWERRRRTQRKATNTNNRSTDPKVRNFLFFVYICTPEFLYFACASQTKRKPEVESERKAKTMSADGDHPTTPRASTNVLEYIMTDDQETDVLPIRTPPLF